MLEGLDPASPTWRALRAWAEQERSDYLTQIAAFPMKPDRADFLRGRIAQIDDLMDQSQPRTGLPMRTP